MSPPFSIALTTYKAFRKGFRIEELPIVIYQRKVAVRTEMVPEAIFGVVRLGMVIS